MILHVIDTKIKHGALENSTTREMIDHVNIGPYGSKIYTEITPKLFLFRDFRNFTTAMKREEASFEYLNAAEKPEAAFRSTFAKPLSPP